MSLLKIKQVSGLQTTLDGAVGGGVVITVDNFTDTTDYTSGTTTQLTLSVTPTAEENVAITMDGVSQHHNTYSLAGAVVTFDTAIPTGTANVEATITENAGTTGLGLAQEWTKTQNFNMTTLTDAASIAWDLESNQVSEVTITANRTLANPTNQVAGATYILIVKQDAGGTNTLAYGSAYLYPGGTAPVVAAGANAISVLSFVSDGTNMLGVSQLDFS